MLEDALLLLGLAFIVAGIYLTFGLGWSLMGAGAGLVYLASRMGGQKPVDPSPPQ